MTVEVHEITLRVLVDKGAEQQDPEAWNWQSILECWAVPTGVSKCVGTFADSDAFFDSLEVSS